MARTDVTNFLLEILEGPNARAIVELAGRELPYRAGAGGAISFGKTQRSNLTWYPGNPVASQQIIGPTLKPTTINGVWKDSFLGTGRAIQLVDLFEELLDTGVQVRMNWSTIERQGIVKDFVWKPGVPTGGLKDIEWTCVFEWNSAGLPPPRRVGESDLTLRDGLVRAASAIAGLGESIATIIEASANFVGLPVRAFQSSKRALENLLGVLSQPLSTLSSSAARLGNEANLPARFMEDASTAAGSAQQTCGQIAEVTSGIFPFERTVLDGLEEILIEALERYDLIEEALDAAREQFDQRVRLEEIVRPPEFARITAVAGTDLRDLAIQFYGTADLWDRIAKQNGLEQSEITEDIEELIIPLSLPDSTDEKVGC